MKTQSQRGGQKKNDRDRNRRSDVERNVQTGINRKRSTDSRMEITADRKNMQAKTETE